MQIYVKENGIFMNFIVTDEKKLLLTWCSTEENKNSEGNKFAQAVEVQCAGYNQNDHHGAKHSYCASSDTLKYVSHKLFSNESGKKLEIELSDDKMKVILNYQFYDGIQAFRSWTDIENIGIYNIGLQYVSSFSFTGIDKKDKEQYVYIPSNSWVREALWKKYTLSDSGLEHINAFSTKRVSASNSGTWSTKEFLPMGCYDNGTVSYMWQIENNGSWNWEISDIKDRMYLKLSGPSENENHWYKELKPNERFSSVKVSVAISNNFTNALSQMTKYRRNITRVNIADKSLPVIFNDYMHCLWANPTTERMIPVIDRAAEAGAEYYCMDAGWYDEGEWWDKVGAWEECKSRFTNGIKGVFDYVRSKGMIPGIWLEIQVVGIESPVAEMFDDSCFFLRHGKRVIDHGRYQFDFRNQNVQKYATSVVDRMVNDYGVGYIKIDYNIDAGIGTEFDSDSFGDGLLEHNRAYIKWIESIMDKYPNLILENCSSGGMCLDYALLSKYSIQSVSDQEDYNYTSVISAAAPTAVLPEQGGIWSYPLESSTLSEVVTNMVNPMLMRMHLGGEIHKLSREQFKIVQDGVKCYKETREKIKNSIVFYPLGLPKVNDEWVAVGFDCGEKSYLKIWRRNAKLDKIKIQIPDKYNAAKLLFAVKDGCNIELKNHQIEIELKDKISAVLIEIY